MKIKFILIVITLLIHSMPATAQLPSSFLMPNQNKQTAFNPNGVFLQNGGGSFDVLGQSNFSAFTKPLSLNGSAANCSEADNLFAPQAAACNGVSVTPINFNNTSRSVVTGTNNTVGVVYRYNAAGTAPDGTVLDALVTVVSYNNNQDATTTSFRDADLPAATAGFDGNLQPSLNQESGTFLNNTSWIGNITYRVQFVITGTSTPKRISIAATTIDNDGSTACGGLRESVAYSTALNQTLTSNSTNQTPVGSNGFQGPLTVQTGIGTGIDFANAGLFVNVTELNWTYSFATAGNCVAGNASEVRYGSLNMSCQINFGRDFASVPVSGTVFNDTNGLTDSTVNGTGTGTPGGTQVYANLLDSNGFVVSSVAVAANGTYSFPTAVNGNYNIQISTVQGIESSLAPAATLPFGWVNTGENLGAGAGNDGTVNGLGNGLLAVTVAGAAVTNANFGIEQRPTANNNAAVSQANPGGTISAIVPATTFTVADTAGGTVSNIRITAFPSNATSLTVGTTTYYPNAGSIPGVCPTATCVVFPAAGVIVPTLGNGNPTTPILVDPAVNTTIAVGIPYVAIDNAGIESLPAATASIPFVNASISGSVFNDTNGLTDSTVNGALPGTNAGGPLYANLYTNAGVFLQSVLVTSGGAYAFPGLNNGTYTVQISTVQGSVGTPQSGTATTPPAGWVYTGENVGAAAGSDGTPNGLLTVTIAGAVDATNANFGIEQRPTANNSLAANQTNPTGTTNAPVPATSFSGTDPVTAVVSNIRITTFPSNATSFTVGTTTYYPNAASIPGVCPTATCLAFPGAGVTIPTNAAGNPTPVISVDPVNGGVTVVFSYVAVDQAGVESLSAATAAFPFGFAPTAADGSIAGTLRFGNSLMPNTLVVLIDTTSSSKSFTRTNANGDYLFDEQETGRTYIVQPLSSKYSFSPGSSAVSLVDNAIGLNFNASAKTYRPKNDFDGDGVSDVAVFRPTDGNWYVLKSSDGQMSVFNFGAETDLPVSADFDGDGKTDYAVFRPSEGNWYIWQSATQDLRVERFGAADDKLVPADFDGDGKADVAVYRGGNWYIKRSSNGAFETKNYGADTDTPLTGDFDNDGKSDFSVYRPALGTWFTLQSSSGNSSARRFGAETDVPVAADFDGDGYADIAQFRSGLWYILNSTTDFEATQLGAGEDKSIVGDYDGDGRADTTTFRNGLWTIRNSADGTIRTVYFGLPTDITIR
jgi:FG-GAP-like repeat